MKNSKEKITCKICNHETGLTYDNFSRCHLKKFHGDYDMQRYYDIYFKKDGDGVCLNCGVTTKFINVTNGYRKYCCAICEKTSPIKKQQLSVSWLGRDMEKVKQKLHETCLEKYGVDSFSKTKEFKDSFEKTCLEKYGVKHNFQTDGCTEKRWKILNDNKEYINKKRKESWTDDKIKSVNDAREKSNLEKYGVKSTTSLDWVKDSMRKTMEDSGKWTRMEDLSKWKQYRRMVWIETRKHIDALLKEWDGLDYYTKEKLLTNEEFRKNNANISTSKNKLQPTIDHKNSIFYGFENDIDISEIGGFDNLCICSRSINSRKSNMNYTQFWEYINNVKKH